MSNDVVSNYIQNAFDIYAQNFCEMAYNTRIKELFDQLAVQKKGSL